MTAMSELPAEAIEAAHKAWRAQAALEGSIFEYNLRAAIEAAPYMLAGAWAAGAQTGFNVTREGFNGECAFDHLAPDNYPPTNPYSGEAWEVDSVEA